MNSDPIDRRTLLTRLAATLSALPALLAAKSHAAPSADAPEESGDGDLLLTRRSVTSESGIYTEYHYDHKGRLVRQITWNPPER